MDRYRRVKKPREASQINENEIRITTQGRMRNYITYATTLLQEKGSDDVVFKAMGRAINKTVMIVELIKRRVVGLHQNIVIGSTDITDTWEPLEEGLLPIKTTRHVSVITITLSKKEPDAVSIGYQPPLTKDQVKSLVELDYEVEGSPRGQGRGRGGRGRGRGRERGNGYMTMDYNDGGWDNRDHGYDGRGRGGYGGRVHAFRGRGRGGYTGWNDYQQDNDGCNEYEAPNPVPGRGRGRGRGRGWGRDQNRGRGRNLRSTNGPGINGGESWS